MSPVVVPPSSRVSIVTPVFNGARWLDPLMKSVRNQTFQDWEHIVVDDGSTDESAHIIEAYARDDPRIRLIKDVNRGVGYARQVGLLQTVSTSDFVMFLDADDVLMRDALSLLVTTLDANPLAPAAHGDASGIDADGEQIAILPVREMRFVNLRRINSRQSLFNPDSPSCGAATDFSAVGYTNPIFTPGQGLIRRGVLTNVGLGNLRLSHAQDYYLWYRISALYGAIAFVPTVTLLYRRSASSMSQSVRKTDRHALYVRYEFLCDGSVPDDLRQFALHLYRLWLVRRAISKLRISLGHSRTADRWGAVQNLMAASGSIIALAGTLAPRRILVRRLADLIQ